MNECMLTTTDNPHNPFTDFDDWYVFDEAQGYHTLAYLGRIVRTSDDLSELDQHQAIEYAIDEIIEEHVLGIYVKVSQPSELQV